MEVKPGYKQTEVGVIPDRWEVPYLRQHLVQDATYGVVKAGTFQRSGIPMLRGGDIKNGSVAEDQPLITPQKSAEYSRTLLRQDDVVIALVGYPGESAVVPERLVGANISRAVGLLRPAPTLSPAFLACYLNSPNGRKEFLRPSAGSAQIVVNLGALNRLRLPLPPPPEQRAIAAALSDVDALLDGLDRLITKKRDLKQAAMQQLLTGRTRLPDFSGEWEVKRLGEVLKFQVGWPFSSAFFNEKEQGVRLVKNRDLKSDDQVFYYSGKYDPAFQVSDGDVLVGMDGDFLPCRWAKGPALLNQRVGRIVPLDGLDREFAFYYLIGPLKEIEVATASTTVKHLSHGDVEGIEKPLPSVREQTAIAAVLSDMDSELAALEARRDKTRDLKQAMMQELLTGKTRLVPAGVAHA
jgi:type I restriction enzyme S subunit